MHTTDILVIGAGIAGASIAAHLAASRKTTILEMEARPGYHSTGRSAASYEPNYGPPAMLAFTRASHDFFLNPPKGFTDSPLLTPRASLFLEAEGQAAHTAALLSKSSGLDEIAPARAKDYFPPLRDGYAKRAFLDSATADMDVDLIHRGYLRLFKERGGVMVMNAPATRATRSNGLWHVETPQGVFQAPVLVDAAGAWGDVLAVQAGLKPVGLQPKRRSIGVIPVEGHGDFSQWALVTDMGESWYAKPQSGKLIVSSADATPVDAHDAYADDMAIAEGVERLTAATTLEVSRLDHSWGGLRSFVKDGNPVVGYDPYAEGFFWLIGQGGYGIQSCPALSETAAAMVLQKPVPDHVHAQGLQLPSILPQRLM